MGKVTGRIRIDLPEITHKTHFRPRIKRATTDTFPAREPTVHQAWFQTSKITKWLILKPQEFKACCLQINRAWSITMTVDKTVPQDLKLTNFLLDVVQDIKTNLTSMKMKAWSFVTSKPPYRPLEMWKCKLPPVTTLNLQAISLLDPTTLSLHLSSKRKKCLREMWKFKKNELCILTITKNLKESIILRIGMRSGRLSDKGRLVWSDFVCTKILERHLR